MIKGKVALIAVTVLLLGAVLAGCVGEELVETEIEVPMPISDVAEGIRSGETDVGTEHGLVFEQRYHTIHALILGEDCTSCHIALDPDIRQEIFSTQDVAPLSPGPADIRNCLGCHVDGPGTPFYATPLDLS